MVVLLDIFDTTKICLLAPRYGGRYPILDQPKHHAMPRLAMQELRRLLAAYIKTPFKPFKSHESSSRFQTSKSQLSFLSTASTLNLEPACLFMPSTSVNCAAACFSTSTILIPLAPSTTSASCFKFRLS